MNEKIRDQLKNIPLALGWLTATVNAFSLIYDDMLRPSTRLGVWFVTAALFWLAFFLNKSRASTVVGIDGNKIQQSVGWRPIAFIFATIASIVFAVDVLISTTLPPVKFNYADSPTEKCALYTENTPGNPLIINNVQAVSVVSTTGEYKEFSFGGVDIGSLIQKRSGFDQLLLHKFIVRVTRFAPMPKCKRVQIQAGATTDKLDASFLLRKKSGDDFPWEFSADSIRVNYRNPQAPDHVLAYKLDDIAPTGIRFYLSASDPGIYWVEPVIVVSAGIAKRKEIVLTKEPIPVAFAGDAKDGDISFNERDVLDGKDKSWIAWPPISESDRRRRIDFIDNPPTQYRVKPNATVGD